MVRWTWWDWSLSLGLLLLSVLWHCWLGHLTPKKPVPDMTYNVFSETLNPAQSVLWKSVGIWWSSWQEYRGSFLKPLCRLNSHFHLNLGWLGQIVGSALIFFIHLFWKRIFAGFCKFCLSWLQLAIGRWVIEWAGQCPVRFVPGHFSDEPFQAVSCTGTDDQTHSYPE